MLDWRLNDRRNGNWNTCKLVLDEKLESLYTLILRKYTLSLQESIKEGSDYGVMNSKQDEIDLPKKIRGAIFNNELNKYSKKAD